MRVFVAGGTGVDDVEHALRPLLHGQDRGARRVVEVHPRGVAGTAAHQRELPLAHQLDVVVGGPRPVQPAVPQGRAAGLDDGGGKAPQWARQVAGAENVSRVLAAPWSCSSGSAPSWRRTR
jgi:hypothetical protein